MTNSGRVFVNSKKKILDSQTKACFLIVLVDTTYLVHEYVQRMSDAIFCVSDGELQKKILFHRLTSYKI